jgi:hypothetical protein
MTWFFSDALALGETIRHVAFDASREQKPQNVDEAHFHHLDILNPTKHRDSGGFVDKA